MTKKILAIIVIILGGVAFWFLSSDPLPKIGTSPSPLPSTNAVSADLSDVIHLEKPILNDLIKSPLTITGEARGYWFFEASFPIKIYDDNGIELGVVPAQAQGDWMTEDFVPFIGVLEFSKPETVRGTLVLEKDNPSGLPEHDAQMSISVIFDLNSWSDDSSTGNNNSGISKKCRITGCSSQICASEDVITTCEYKDEYACYKEAKCEVQENGECGWTPTETLVMCLTEAFQGE